LEDKAVRQARIILRLLITRRPLLVIGPEDSTAHRVRTILRPVIARLPRCIPLLVLLGTNNNNSIDVPGTTDIQGLGSLLRKTVIPQPNMKAASCWQKNGRGDLMMRGLVGNFV
jgi:hypothetical protein